MDNLFNLQKLFSAFYMVEALAHGVARTNGRGLPPSIIQWEEKNAKLAESLRGTTKAARLHNSDECLDLVAISIYDSKPVHILSTAAECVEWTVKERQVWSASIQQKAMMKYLHLNVIEDYNQHMNSTDIANQQRGNYWPDRWMRQRKWWWAFFIRGIGVAGVNEYKIDEVIYDKEAVKGTPFLQDGHMQGSWKNLYMILFSLADCIGSRLILPRQAPQHTTHQFACFLCYTKEIVKNTCMTCGAAKAGRII